MITCLNILWPYCDPVSAMQKLKCTDSVHFSFSIFYVNNMLLDKVLSFRLSSHIGETNWYHFLQELGLFCKFGHCWINCWLQVTLCLVIGLHLITFDSKQVFQQFLLSHICELNPDCIYVTYIESAFVLMEKNNRAQLSTPTARSVLTLICYIFRFYQNFSSILYWINKAYSILIWSSA